jgi:hypothetical protein
MQDLIKMEMYTIVTYILTTISNVTWIDNF